MKQLLFLLLFPCLCVAQYTGNAGQKITLGEQTTADGLVWRGRLADTANLLTNKLDTSVYIVLDTGTRAMWYYRASTTPKWTRLVDSLNNMQGQLSLTTKVTGTLPVANGGTNASTFAAGSVVFAGASGTSLMQDNANLFWDDSNNRLGIGTASPSQKLHVDGDVRITGNIAIGGTEQIGRLRLFSANTNLTGLNDLLDCTNTVTGYRVRITGTNDSDQRVFMGTSTTSAFVIGTNVTQRLRIDGSTGSITINNLIGTGDRAVLADVNGVLSAPISSITTKENVQTLNYGLNEILQINPVSFDYINKDKWGDERKLGFIVEDMFPIVPEVTGTMNNGDMYLDMTKLIPILTKAIQEQNALIKALEQRLLILENK